MRIKTYVTKPAEVEREWWVVDAKGLTLGRLAAKLAPILMGKNKANFAPNVDQGDFVIVVNAEHIHVTGKKMEEKMYYRHSGYPGGLYTRSLREMLDKFPDRVIQAAVKGMLPHTPMGRKMLKKLKIYAGEAHPHEAQQPKKLEL